MLTLSFIIPVYNCKDYLSKCFDEIFNSQLEEDRYEIVCVDDGSTDNSADVIKSYKKFHDNIKYIYQSNSGPATARNMGLRYAQGDYVWFVDADDSIVADALPSLLNTLLSDKTIEVLSFNYRKVYVNSHEDIVIFGEPNKITATDYLLSCAGRMYLWSHIFRRDVLKRSFLEGVKHIEDMCYIVQNLLKCSFVYTLPVIGYCYNQSNISSISHTHTTSQMAKANEDAFRVYSTLNEDLKTETDKEIIKVLTEIINFGVAGHLYTMIKETPYKEIKTYIKKYQDLKLYPIKKTKNKKANLFIPIANNNFCLYAYYKFTHLFK